MTGLRRRYIRTGAGGGRAGVREWKSLNGSKRKIEYGGGNAVKGQKEGREGGREKKRKRKKVRGRCGLRGKSAEAAMFPRQKRLVYYAAISSPSSSTSRRERVPSEQRVKDRDIASLCTRTPFPSFIYLCLPAAGNARLSPALFSGCSIIPL